MRARLLDLVPGPSRKAYPDWLTERGEPFRTGVKVAARWLPLDGPLPASSPPVQRDRNFPFVERAPRRGAARILPSHQRLVA